MDWNALKTEYITTSISYRKLAEKHNISFDTLKYQAKTDKWYQARQEFRHNVTTKSLAEAAEKEVDYKSALYDLAYKVARQLNDMTDQYTVSELSAIGIKPRDITGAIKDLEDALHVKSASDIKEQEARIANLRKNAETEDTSKEIKVTIVGDLENYSK